MFEVVPFTTFCGLGENRKTHITKYQVFRDNVEINGQYQRVAKLGTDRDINSDKHEKS